MEGEVRMRVYCAYGYPAEESGASIAFNGEWLDSISQGYLLGSGYRLYSPTLRRFFAADTYSPFGAGGLNAYAYCAGDPVNRVDPSGHKLSITGALKAVGIMKRTGRRSRSEVSVLSYDDRKSQPQIMSYNSLDMDLDELNSQHVKLPTDIRKEQIESVFFEYVAAEALGALGDTMRQHLGSGAEESFTHAQQQILEQSIFRIRHELPPRQYAEGFYI